MSARQDVINKGVIKVLGEWANLELTEKDFEKHLMYDLGLDSLDQVEIIMALEDEFGIEISDESAVDAMTPKALADLVDNLLP